MDKLLTHKNVVGIADGIKWSNGRPTGKSALLVFVDHKVAEDELDPKDIIPKKINGRLTDVVGRTGAIKALATKPFTTTKVLRPIIPGISIGATTSRHTGTLGAIFKDKSGRPVILSNNHVIAGTNGGKVGDLIIQPGLYDTTKRNVVGKLKNFVRLANGVDQDSAIASISVPYDTYINGIGRPRGFATAKVGLTVRKSGRTTKVTSGRIIGVNGRFWVDYGTMIVKLNNCIVTTSMGDAGDSGALLLSATGYAVGLFFAGSPSITLHSGIGAIVNKYGLSLI